jgi:hypothetical protein
MLSYQIIYGFSDIKSAFRTKSRIIKPIDELELWFTFSENVLYVHDYDEFLKYMPLAVYQIELRTWEYFLKTGSYGDRLVRDVCENTELNKIQGKIKTLYNSHGFIRLSHR